jgi:tetratricopeptide (TPR) repeat protein
MNRKRTAFSKLAASSLLVATSMVGCTGQALHRQAGVSAGKLGTMADAQARNAEAALKQHDAAKAIQLAEAAVAASPDKAEFRTLLGRAYLMDGRFASARQAFEDALTLGSTDGRTIVNLSLIHVAEGDSKGAQRLLTDRVDVLTAADYGLAMAMAGNPMKRSAFSLRRSMRRQRGRRSGRIWPMPTRSPVNGPRRVRLPRSISRRSMPPGGCCNGRKARSRVAKAAALSR